jgi:cytochrome P450
MQQALAAAEDDVVSFHEYIEQLIRERRESLGSDVLSLMIKNQDQKDLSDHQVAIQAVQIVAAGHITTVDLLGNAMVALLRHPQQLQRLRDEPSLIDSAVEEMLRYDTSIPLTHRMATRDVTMGGKTIVQGDLVFPILAAANRDPAVFAMPDTFDIGRTHNAHVSFIAGPHFCAGAALARMELNLAFTTLLRRFGHMQLAANGLAWKQGHLMFRGPSKLYVKIG